MNERSACTDSTTLVLFVQRAWLHRKGKASWEFAASSEYGGELVHVTRSGTVYAILSDHKLGKPFWIGRLQNDAWLTSEREVRATSIEFEDSGSYHFPPAYKK